MLLMIRSLQMEQLFLRMQPLLLGSFVKWSLLFAVIFIILSIYKKLSSDVRHVTLLLLIYAVVLIPLANAIFPLEWFGDTTLTRQGNEISRAVSAALMPHYFEGTVRGAASAGASHQLLTPASSPAGVSWPMILVAIWAAGVAAASTGLVIGRWRVGVLYRHQCDKPSVRVERELEGLVKRLGMRTRVVIVISRLCRVPFTFRVFKPLIVLPRTSESWPSQRVRAVLLHELSHIRRGDYLTKLLARLVCSLFWFLPFLWIAFSRLSREQETACDLSVLRMGVRPTAYARHILDVASISVRNLSFQGSFLAEGRKKTLERRIIHTLQFSRSHAIRRRGIKKKTTRFVLFCTLIAAAIAVIGSCAASRKTITETDFLAAWSGTWVNEELDGRHVEPQILVNHPDGTMEFFIDSAYMESGKRDMRVRNYGVPSITDMWADREGKIWYTAATEPVESGILLSYYGFIDASGDVLEIHEAMSNRIMDAWDTDDFYFHRVYYRQHGESAGLGR
jgi:beta-lactamase regulating signal transducer with metallopeptidase domain